MFEDSSGAILSRNMKCKIIGFGSWEGKDEWPLRWIKTEKSVKIFGIFIIACEYNITRFEIL